MWRAGETREVSNHRAHYLIEEGLAIEAADQAGTDLKAEPSPLQQAADAIGATVAPPQDANLPAVADALGAKVATKPDTDLEPVTTASTKKKPKPGEDRETKPATGPAETK